MESVKGHWKTTANGERPGESRFAIQCSPHRSPFAAPFPIYFFQCSLFKVRYSMFAAPFAIPVRHSPRHSSRRSPFAAPFASSFAAPFTIHRAVSYSFSTIFAIQTSLFNVSRAVSHSQFAIRQSPSHSPFAAPFADAFHRLDCPASNAITRVITFMEYTCMVLMILMGN